MGQRSRRRSEGTEAMRRGYARGEARNEEIRRSLEPVAPGELPGPVAVAAVVAALLGVANIVLLAAGFDVRGKDPSVPGTITFAAVMFAAAYFMWRGRYWAVLGFQALLGLTLLITATSLAVASTFRAAAVCIAILLLGGWLFWKLIRSMARLQMPQRPGAG